MQRGDLDTLVKPEILPEAVFKSWLVRFGEAVERRDADGVVQFFDPEGFWRDMLSFTWERRTFHGPAEIRDAFKETAGVADARNFRIAAERTRPRFARRSGRRVIEAWFDFDTAAGTGAGFMRLLQDDADPFNPRIWLLLTTLHELRGFEEKVGARRPTGEEYSQIQSAENWKQQRERELAFEDRDPEVLIIGAGHSGLMLAARLRQMGVDTLVVEKSKRVGDNWRHRYSNLTLHNELSGNHFPYLPFPSTWPVWLPKDKIAGWLEAYAEFLELNVWTGTQLISAVFDESAKTWTVTLRSADGAERIMRCRQLVAAMGVSGGAPKKPDLPGLSDFAGAVLHSAEFTSGADWAGKRAIVVGTGNSGHDIAQDLHVGGAADVSIMQRGPTCIVSLEPGATISYAIYREEIPSEDVDLMVSAIPYPMLIESYKWITKKTTALDKEVLDDLNSVGFKTHLGEDETGFQLLYLRGLGGYYIDVGCSDLIINGKIGLIQAEDTDRFFADGLRMRDGTIVPCDLVVLATGFENMQESIRKILGSEVADRIGPVWGFDEDDNMRNMWKPTAQEGFWIMGGAILEARLNSRFLALQIKASLEGRLPVERQSSQSHQHVPV